MFERFTHQARLVIVMAQDEAKRTGQDHIGPEHLLLGLASTDAGVSAEALGALGISLDAARSQVDALTGPGPAPGAEGIPFSSAAKDVIQGSLAQAVRSDDERVGTEHLLLSLLRDRKGPAIQVLADLGVTPDQVRARLDVATRGLPGDQDLGIAAPAPPGSGDQGRQGRQGRRGLRSRLRRP